MNKGERLALEILPKYGFKNLKKQRLIDFSAIYNDRRVQVEVKYRKTITGSIKLSKKQKNEADFLLICNEDEHVLLRVSDLHDWEPITREYRGHFSKTNTIEQTSLEDMHGEGELK